MVFFCRSLTGTITHVCGSQPSNNVATICSYDYNMEIFLVKFGYYNERHT
jgi:hypothetical protein